MKTVKLTFISTIFVAALGLALGLVAAPAMADKPNNCPDHPHGCGGDEPETSFEVSLTELDNFGPEWGTETDCIGTTNPPQLGAQFDEAGLICSVDIGGLVLNLFSITVRVRGNGMTDMMLYFTSGTVFIPPESDTVYATERLGVVVVPGVPPGGFTLQLNAEGDDVIKIHQPDKGEVVGQISVGSFSYAPID